MDKDNIDNYCIDNRTMVELSIFADVYFSKNQKELKDFRNIDINNKKSIAEWLKEKIAKRFKYPKKDIYMTDGCGLTSRSSHLPKNLNGFFYGKTGKPVCHIVKLC